MKRMFAGLAAAALAVAIAQPAAAQFGGPEATAVKPGFLLPPGEARILVFRPDIAVGEQTTGGMNEPNADWTRTARANLLAALARAPVMQGNRVTLAPDLQGADSAALNDYTALFKTVAQAAFSHKMFPGNRLPTKKSDFDWTLGEGAAALKPLGGDYGLFFLTYDSYGSAGRKVAQILGAVMGLGLMSSGVHIGYAGLVDLKTGDLVWLNADTSMGGDPRDAVGADKRMAQLLEDFPKKAGTGPTGTVKVDVPPEKKPEQTKGEPQP
ncbi:hypothetical protein [Novosphingobium sp. Gsoil 351]|uniref:hypothetical protein n=1 Tax=Novosphingobium sp. Gsoil 351 TaxID=2675225 RepID=UPI0018A7EF0D|nr:hypothetical protein [Novosphingobium sp. Gsoil 351]